MSVSVVIPGIRTHLWPKVCETLKASVGRYDWEVIFVGPFDPPDLSQYPVKYIKSYAPVPVCIQKGILEASKEFVYQTTDDCIFVENEIENCLTAWKANYLNDIDILNMRYSEGIGYSGPIQGVENWMVKNFSEFWLPYIDKNWHTSVQPLIKRKRLLEIGGLDCRFQYSNHSHHDLIFRLQKEGSLVYHTATGVSRADWCPGAKEHKPIEYAQNVQDLPVFNELWSNPRDSFIDINNYKQYDKPWKARFPKEYSSYDEMVKEENYA